MSLKLFICLLVVFFFRVTIVELNASRTIIDLRNIPFWLSRVKIRGTLVEWLPRPLDHEASLNNYFTHSWGVEEIYLFLIGIKLKRK